MCLAQGHKAVTPVRLEPAALRSPVRHSTTEPLRYQLLITQGTNSLLLKFGLEKRNISFNYTLLSGDIDRGIYYLSDLSEGSDKSAHLHNLIRAFIKTFAFSTHNMCFG